MDLPLALADPLNTSDAASPLPFLAQPPLVASDAVNDGRWRNWSSTLRGGVARAQLWIRSLGPYVAIELLLPGGTIIAFALWAYRQWRAARGQSTELVPAKSRAPHRCVTPCMQR